MFVTGSVARSGGRHSHNRVLHILKILIKVVPVANQDSERFPNSQTTVFCPGDDLIPTIWYLPILHAEKQQRANRIYSKNGVTRANSFRYEFQNSATLRSHQKTTFWRCRKNVVRRNVWETTGNERAKPQLSKTFFRLKKY